MPRKKICKIGLLQHQAKQIRELQKLVAEKRKKVGCVKRSIKALKSRLEKAKEEKGTITDETKRTSQIYIPVIRKQRYKSPVDVSELGHRSLRRRRAEMITLCHQIHGGSDENPAPTVTGILDTLAATSKCSATLAEEILATRPRLAKHINRECHKINRQRCLSSFDNMTRSLNVYYSHNVMGKRKYQALRSANKCEGELNFTPYQDLSKHIQSIDIGLLHHTSTLGTDTSGLEPLENIEGYYRNLRVYALRLAQFYLDMDEKRDEKLNSFPGYPRKNASSFLFLMAIGGDQAPLVGTSFLLSFLNVGKKVASSFDNFLLFGTNAKESSYVVKMYLQKLLEDIKFLEENVFSVEINGQTRYVEFKLRLLPNDMKMLCFLCGELTNASTFFTSFADVAKHDSTDLSKRFSLDGDEFWKPWAYERRVSDAARVEMKKSEIDLKENLSKRRSVITQYISTVLKSRQEFLPHLGEYIDLVRCEPLHVKNNVVKELFMIIFNIAVKETAVPKCVSKFKNLSDDHIFKEFVLNVKSHMRSTQLAKQMITWFNDSLPKLHKSTKEFDFRFRGKESRCYLLYFPSLISSVMKKCKIPENRRVLYSTFYRSIYLREVISLSVRIEDITGATLTKMEVAARKLFCASVLVEKSVTPSLWVLCNVAPIHARELYDELGYGLGINTMEGREQKHQQIQKYAVNSTFQRRWEFIFRHEFIQLVHLPNCGEKSYRYNGKTVSYTPTVGEGQCSCSLPLVAGKCEICSSVEIKELKKQVEAIC